MRIFVAHLALKNSSELPMLGGMIGTGRPQRERERCEGFTLVEVLLVTAVIGVLLAIAIPAFLGTKTRVQDRSAQANLRIAFANAKALHADADSFAKVTSTTLQAAEPSLTFTGAPSTAAKMISVHSGPGGIVLAAQSVSGVCYAIGDASNPAGTVYQNLGTDTCDASAVTSLPSAVPSADHAVAGQGWAKAW